MGRSNGRNVRDATLEFLNRIEEEDGLSWSTELEVEPTAEPKLPRSCKKQGPSTGVLSMTQNSEMSEEGSGGKQLTNTEHKLTEEPRADQERKGTILNGSSETKMKIREDHQLLLKKALQREEPVFRPHQNKRSIRNYSEFILAEN